MVWDNVAMVQEIMNNGWVQIVQVDLVSGDALYDKLRDPEIAEDDPLIFFSSLDSGCGKRTKHKATKLRNENSAMIM